MAYAVSALNGSPFMEYWHNGRSADEMWNIIQDADDEHDIITAGSNFCAGGDSSATEQGVACSHAYTIITTYELEVPGSDTVRLLKVRNPWGEEQYAGPWSD